MRVTFALITRSPNCHRLIVSAQNSSNNRLPGKSSGGNNSEERFSANLRNSYGWDLDGAPRAIANAQFLKLQIASATESAIRHSDRMLKFYPDYCCFFSICVLLESRPGAQI